MIDTHVLAFTLDADIAAMLPSAPALASAMHGVAWPACIEGVDVFAPHPEHARLEVFGDGPPPFAIVECRVRSLDAIAELARDAGLRAALARPASAGRWRAGGFQVVHEPVPEPARDGAQAPLSLVVHYYGPVDDAAAFAAHYVAHHPALLARLPRVRDVLCYLPLGTPTHDWTADLTVIRNEVRFDSMDDLLAAMRAPAMRDLRADTKGFPPFGRSTHHPMLRQRVV